MSFFGRAKSELKRLVTLQLHSYWEVFYLDLILLLVVILCTIPAIAVMEWFQWYEGFERFFRANIESPIERSVVRHVTPSGLGEKSYHCITDCLIMFVELVLIHLMFCYFYHHAKKTRSLQISTSADEVACKSALPRFAQNKATGLEEKPSLWRRCRIEMTRLFSLDLTSCWEVFYLDAILVLVTFVLSVPLSYLIRFLSLEESFIASYETYIEKPVEANIIRAVAPAGLDEMSYKWITLAVIVCADIALFHAICCLGYLCSGGKTTKPSKDVESGCFSRVKVAPKDEKKRPIEKIYQTLHVISSSSLYPKGSTEKLIEKAAFP